MMTEAGFVDVRIPVRHSGDPWLLRKIKSPETQSQVGRLAGWYVIATGTAPVCVTTI